MWVVGGDNWGFSKVQVEITQLRIFVVKGKTSLPKAFFKACLGVAENVSTLERKYFLL